MTNDRDSEQPVSGRVALACLAAELIERSDEVAATTGPAGRWLTIAPERIVRGVLAVEDGQGRVEIELHLLVRCPPPMPLSQLGEQLRRRMRRLAAEAGMSERLGAVFVAFDDVLSQTQTV